MVVNSRQERIQSPLDLSSHACFGELNYGALSSFDDFLGFELLFFDKLDWTMMY